MANWWDQSFPDAVKAPLRLQVRPKGGAAAAAIAAQNRKDAAWRAEAKRAVVNGVPAAAHGLYNWAVKPGSIPDALSGGFALAKEGIDALPGLVASAPDAARKAVDFATRDPAGAASIAGETVANLLPGVGAAKTFRDATDSAAAARAAGDDRTADMISAMTVPLAGLALGTDGSGALALRGLTGAGRRAAYSIAEQSPFKVVTRRGVGREIERMPEAAGANMEQLRALAQDRTRSPLIRVADDASRQARGVPYDEAAPTPVSSLQRQGGIGRAFKAATENDPAYQHAVFERYGEMMPQVVEQAKAQNYNQLLEGAYGALGNEVGQQFDRLPLQMRYHNGEGEYPSSTAMARDVLGNGRLSVFSGGDPHEFLSKIDPATGLSQNEMFRAVHDALGHVVPGSMFGPKGEEVAYAAHSQTLSPLAQLALLSETRGQNSFVNFSPVNADLIAQKDALRRLGRERSIAQDYLSQYKLPAPDIEAALRDMPSHEDILKQQVALGNQFQYAPQKAVLLPPEYLDPMSQGGMPSWLRPLLNPENGSDVRGVHFSRDPNLTQTDPSMFGTGHRGEEYRRTKQMGLPDRTYFYSGPQGSVTAEQEVARKAQQGGVYGADLNNVYDVNKDPEGLVKLAQAHNGTNYQPVLPYYLSGPVEGDRATPDMERLIRDYGYSGYLSDYGRNRAAAMYSPVNVSKLGDDPWAAYCEGGSVSPPNG